MPGRIVMIEDNEQNRYMAIFLLEKHGYEVLTAPDGPSGIALTTEARPDLILLDIQLPGMDGYAVARALRGDPSLAGVPIVAVTSYAMLGDREKALAAGCDGYLEKPIDPDRFASQIAGFLAGEAKDGRP